MQVVAHTEVQVDNKEAVATPHLRIGEAADYLCQAWAALKVPHWGGEPCNKAHVLCFMTDNLFAWTFLYSLKLSSSVHVILLCSVLLLDKFLHTIKKSFHCISAAQRNTSPPHETTISDRHIQCFTERRQPPIS
jgi:hypothetical protein